MSDVSLNRWGVYEILIGLKAIWVRS